MTTTFRALQVCDACLKQRRTWAVERSDREWRICLACLLAVVKQAEGDKGA